MIKQKLIELKEVVKSMKMVVLVLVPVLLGVIGQLFLKQGMLQVGEFSLRTNILSKFITIFTNPFVLVGLTIYFLSALLWLIVLSRIELSFAYPLLSVGYVLVLIASWLIFKENVSLIRWGGVLVICAGVYLISRS